MQFLKISSFSWGLKMLTCINWTGLEVPRLKIIIKNSPHLFPHLLLGVPVLKIRLLADLPSILIWHHLNKFLLDKVLINTMWFIRRNYWELDYGSNYLLTNHALISTSSLTTDRWFQILSDKSCFHGNIHTDHWGIIPFILSDKFCFYRKIHTDQWQMIQNFDWQNMLHLQSSYWHLISNFTEKLCFDLNILNDLWEMAPNYFIDPYWPLLTLEMA